LVHVKTTKEIGDLGEKIAKKYLENKGFKVIAQNYRKKWGEIDLIAVRKSVYHFVEVKSVAREKPPAGEGEYRPEENVHPQKLKRLHRAIETYLAEYNVESDWQLDVVGVFLNLKDRKAHCRILENVL